MPQNHTTRYVAADPKPPRVEIIHSDLPPAPISDPMPLSSYKDKAHGFVLVTMPLAAATGFVVLLIAVSAFGVPVLSVAALLVSLAGFTVAWLVALIGYQIISAEGALLIHVLSMWAYLKREQRDRFDRYRNKT